MEFLLEYDDPDLNFKENFWIFFCFIDENYL